TRIGHRLISAEVPRTKSRATANRRSPIILGPWSSGPGPSSGDKDNSLLVSNWRSSVGGSSVILSLLLHRKRTPWVLGAVRSRLRLTSVDTERGAPNRCLPCLLTAEALESKGPCRAIPARDRRDTRRSRGR